MELLGERPAWSMSGGELLSTLDALDAAIARLESYRLSVVATVESTGYAAELGARDTAELLRFRYRLDAPTARRTLRLAQALPKYPTMSAALEQTAALPGAPGQTDDADAGLADASDGADGELGAGAWQLRPAQADAIVSALERVPAHVPVDDRDAAERELVKLAAHLSPTELRQAGNKMRDILDTDGPEPEELKAYDRETLTLAPADRGVKFRGYLANENAELLRALIHAGARPHKTIDGEPDPRPRDKRQADALTTALTIASGALEPAPPTDRSPSDRPPSDRPPSERPSTAARYASDSSGSTSPTVGPKAQLTVTIDFEDLKAATADASGQLVYGDGLSAATVRRLACDARIIPLVLGTNSEPLDVGRAERLVTRAMRRALNARDKGCVVCGAPPIMCDAHHLLSWIDGGETKISNLALLCRRHHVDLHQGRWTITLTNGKVHVSRPTWSIPPPTPHHPAAPTPTTHQPPANPTANPAGRPWGAPAYPPPGAPACAPAGGSAGPPAGALGRSPARTPGSAPASAPGRAPVGAPAGPPAGLSASAAGGAPTGGAGGARGSAAARRSRWKANAAVLEEAAAFASAGPPTGR